MSLSDPIVIDPPGFNQKAAWNECKEYVERCGGLSHPDGEPNWRAAFGADPGVCSCPACREMHWMWGRCQRCTKCGFEYPVDAWPMYSYGTQEAGRRDGPLHVPPAGRKRLAAIHERRMAHPYYRYGFEHPTEEAMDEFKRIDWRAVVGNVAVYPEG